MSIEIAIPFRLDEYGKVAVEPTIQGQVRQHVMSLVNTEPGERVVIGDYGVPLVRMLFEDGDDSMVGRLSDLINRAFAKWEPGVGFRNISRPDPRTHDGRAEIRIEYLRPDSPEVSEGNRFQNIAIIKNGAQVSEVVRG